ncbi:hypothetical protein BGW36DRAFT_397695 [Talaromyces proteolyticus]|uniref:Nucleoside phosphorylase domain-containing protein n=1 Tax=Talaromyces proteolyticus TaxID=1131652 RepID=A0AAD4PZJ5_9EURO|nr:uncharacterized protein BGW36DRAFT_397695 [Talaromyces proteolyticus]KAH8696051.1 hypothetical protein BGW36DRAFT_397695 [Talaromyces proteolyticus]
MSKKRLDHSAYTVSWVTTLHRELVASRLLLDEEHEDLFTNAQDPNSYILGEIGVHNIVSVFPGEGQSGVVPAAHIVAHMVHASPNIQFGLLIGIGVVAPRTPDLENSYHDIRLGTSLLLLENIPTDEAGGMVHYDKGHFEESGCNANSHVNKPPDFLLKRAYDKLFKASTFHIGKDNCSMCDSQALEKRIDRDEPTVHYGLMASGSQVIASAKRRDELRDKRNILCFETEVAGLINYFPCIAIIGISN